MSNLSIVIPSEVKGVFSLQKTNPKQATTRRANSMGLDPAHRTPRRFRLADPFHFVILSEAKNLLFGLHHAAASSHVLAAHRGYERFGMTRLKRNRRAEVRLTYTSRLLSGTHKNLHAL